MSNTGPEVLSIRHFSQLKPITCSVVSGNIGSFFTVKMLDALPDNGSIQKGDPIIFGAMDSNDGVTISGGNIMAFIGSESSIVITPDKIFSGSEKRQAERFPVSLCGNLVALESGKKQRSHAFVKDMSYSGFRIYTDSDLPVGDVIEVDIFLHNSMVSISGTVMRKSVFYGRNEYGIQTIFRDKSAIYAIQEFLDKLVIHEKDLIKKQLLKNMAHIR